MSHFTLYHPNKSNTGSAAQFFVSDRDNGLYLKITKQVSWDESRRAGSFYANTKDPDKHVMIKFSQVELGNWLLLLEKGVEFKSMHKSKDRTLNFTFTILKKENVPIGLSLSIYKTSNDDSTQKQQFGILLKFNEAISLKYFIIEALKRSFETPDKGENKAAAPDVAEAPEAEEHQAQADGGAAVDNDF